jgi:UPF0755 protein
MKILNAILGAFLALFLLALTGLGVVGYREWTELQRPLATTERFFEVRRGESFHAVVDRLADQGLNPSPLFVKAYARVDQSLRQIKAGEYALSPNDSTWDILKRLRRGQVAQHAVTIPEGWNIEQIAVIVEAAGVASAADFRRLATDATLPGQFGVVGTTLEGYLYPDTYFFARNVGARKVIETMVDRFWQSIPPDFETRVATFGLSLPEAITLASIVEKETGHPDERPLVSAVFHNRLKKGMRLQSDPTVIYGMSNYQGRIRKVDLLTHTPYNTYRINGLPPGPIANPGRASLLAVLDPAPVTYLYFVSKNDGSHYFSNSLVEHNRAVNLYQRGINPDGTRVRK